MIVRVHTLSAEATVTLALSSLLPGHRLSLSPRFPGVQESPSYL